MQADDTEMVGWATRQRWQYPYYLNYEEAMEITQRFLLNSGYRRFEWVGLDPHDERRLISGVIWAHSPEEAAAVIQSCIVYPKEYVLDLEESETHALRGGDRYTLDNHLEIVEPATKCWEWRSN